MLEQASLRTWHGSWELKEWEEGRQVDRAGLGIWLQAERRVVKKNQHWERRLYSWKCRKPEHWQKKQFSQRNIQTILCPSVVFTPVLTLVSNGIILLSLVHFGSVFICVLKLYPTTPLMELILPPPTTFVFEIFFPKAGQFKVFIDFVTILLLSYVLCFLTMRHEILVPQPRIEPVPPALGRWSPNH